MNRFRGEKIEFEYDSHEREFTLTIYDVHGHYIDSIKVDKVEIGELYKYLDNLKKIFQYFAFQEK